MDSWTQLEPVGTLANVGTGLAVEPSQSQTAEIGRRGDSVRHEGLLGEVNASQFPPQREALTS